MATVMRIGNMQLDAKQAYKVIHSVGWDAANAHAAKHGRTVWTDADYNVACSVSNRMMVEFGLAPAPKARKSRSSRKARS